MTFEYLGNRRYKERRTETHVYFVGGPFSQWWKSKFEKPAFSGTDIQKWTSCEQYMMASKALLFDDEIIYRKMLTTHDPKELKSLGRLVQNFDQSIWESYARDIVYEGNMGKFQQSEELFAYLRDTNGRRFVEGAWYDEVWGVKLAYDDPKIEDEENWRGTNWLGEVLDRVYGELIK